MILPKFKPETIDQRIRRHAPFTRAFWKYLVSHANPTEWPPAQTKNVTSLSSLGFPVPWSTAGSTPYVDTDDGDTNKIIDGFGVNITGDFAFSSISELGTIDSVTLRIKGKAENLGVGTINLQADVWNGAAWLSLVLYQLVWANTETSYVIKTIDLIAAAGINTWAKVAALKLRLSVPTGSGTTPILHITYVDVVVTTT